MNLETNTISFDLVPELFIDKFDEKVKKLKENEVGCFSNMDVKTINANNKIYIFLILNYISVSIYYHCYFLLFL